MGCLNQSRKLHPDAGLVSSLEMGLDYIFFWRSLNLTSSPLETVYIEKTGVNLRPFDLEIGLKKPKPGNGGPEGSGFGTRPAWQQTLHAIHR
jgi:hypothetical protein